MRVTSGAVGVEGAVTLEMGIRPAPVAMSTALMRSGRNLTASPERRTHTHAHTETRCR